MDEVAFGLSNEESNSRTLVSLDAVRELALHNIEAFVQTFSDQQALTAAASSWAPATLNQVAEDARIQEAGHLIYSSQCQEVGMHCTMQFFFKRLVQIGFCGLWLQQLLQQFTTDRS